MFMVHVQASLLVRVWAVGKGNTVPSGICPQGFSFALIIK